MKDSKLTALIYARVSSERQKNEGHGLDSQEHRCRSFATGKGYPIEKVFKDSFSGKGDFMQRPAMVELLAHIDEHPYKNYVVIFDDLKRLARDLEFHWKLRKAFSDRGTRVESPNFTFGESDEDWFMETMFAAQGELERRQNRRQVIQKQKARLESGYWPFYPPPGYIQKRTPLYGKVLTPDEPTASIIREALEGYASGRFQDQVEVQKFLILKGFYSGRKNKKIYIEQVTRLLTRIVYAGYIEYPDWEVSRRKGHHEGLISLDTFLAIQERLKGKAKTFIRKDLNPDFPSRGLVCCASCKHSLTASWSSGRNKRFPYYRCNSQGCSDFGRSVPRDKIETGIGVILEALKPRQEVLNYTKARLLAKWQKRVTQLNLARQARERELAGVREEIKSLSQLAGTAKDARVRGAYEARLGTLVDQEADLEVRAAKLPERAISFETAIEAVFEYLKNPYTKWYAGDLAEKRLVLKLVFSDLLAYDRKNGFETAQLALPLKVFEAISAPELVGCGDGGS